MPYGTLAAVQVSGVPGETYIPITSDDKPAISNTLVTKWQSILDLAAQIIGVPAGLIMRVHAKQIEVFLSSHTGGNPYHPHEKADLRTGLYCETVMGRRQELLVPDAMADPAWQNNPDVPLQMISYLGIPIAWADGEIFGTFCVLDRKANEYTPLYRQFIAQLRDIIEEDLKLLMTIERLKKEAVFKELQIREIHHRVKNHFNFLIGSLYMQRAEHQSGGSINKVVEEFESRILTISMIHDKLYQTKEVESISLREYLSDLGAQIIENNARKKIAFLCEADEFSVGPGTSVPCGLMINEWVTNSLKHAFDGHPDPVIRLEVRALGGGRAKIIYRDNGVGISGGASVESASRWDAGTGQSLGSFLVTQFVRELDGQLTVKNEGGVCYEVEFPLPA